MPPVEDIPNCYLSTDLLAWLLSSLFEKPFIPGSFFGASSKPAYLADYLWLPMWK